MTAIAKRAIALALMIWTVNLSMLVSHGLEELGHQHEAGAPCVSALLIEHWFETTSPEVVTWPALVQEVVALQPLLWRLVWPQSQRIGNRDPPSVHY